MKQMKPWDYYNMKGDYAFPTPLAIPYKIRKRMKAKIDNMKLTVKGRKELEASVMSRSIAIAARANRAYKLEAAKRNQELQDDQRAQLRYGDMPKEIITAIEQKAYEDGHSGGISEVYWHISELVDFAKVVMKAVKDAN